MKRPPGLWVLLSAGVLWLSLQDCYCIKATSLIFGKHTTTTTTSSSEANNSTESSQDESTATEASTEASNVTKPTLTGIPQIDYIWEPNLPKELNGYNLSAYPFYERVPEDIDFKCDGLHDGFYASVPHKCQVYHHCLFGTRYDFLCANYTAFDQKTFICHFVSEVDCVNSKKYWHRNDALYKAASTTTIKPTIIYTPPPQPPPSGEGSAPSRPRRPGGGRLRPSRRRPQYEYYDDYEEEYDDDYYEERPPRRKHTRPRRPVYQDDYDEYEDDRYERRGSGRRRRPYDRRDERRPERRRNKDRRKHEDDIEDEKRSNDRRKYSDDDKLEEEEEHVKVSDKRPSERRYQKRRPSVDYSTEDDDRRRSRPKGSRRPVEDDYEDELPPRDKASPPEAADDKPLIKPTSGSSIYDRPRAAPRIKPPVPKSEANKYAYKPAVTTPQPPPEEDEEYYDDYEEELPLKDHKKSESSESRRHSSRREEERDTRKQSSSASRLRPQSSRDESHGEEPPSTTKRYKNRSKYGTIFRERPKSVTTSKKQPVDEEDYDDYEEESKELPKPTTKTEKNNYKERTSSTSTTTTTTTTTTTPRPTTTITSTTTKDVVRDRPESIVRIVKRPFLPSRGGNPLAARGLQPVGAKASDKQEITEEDTPPDTQSETMEIKPLFKSSPVVVKVPIRQKYIPPVRTEQDEEFKPVSNRPQIPPRSNFKPNKEFNGPRTTQKPKIAEPDPLDIADENEYDVTLNDALNPTLPNLPIRSFPTGFSSSDYSYRTFQGPRFAVEPSNVDYVFQPKPVRQRYEPHSVAQDHFVNSNTDFKGQYSTVQTQQYRPRVTQVYYSSF